MEDVVIVLLIRKAISVKIKVSLESESVEWHLRKNEKRNETLYLYNLVQVYRGKVKL